MKEILLTQGKATIVDDEDFDRLNVHKWHAVKIGKIRKIFYAARCSKDVTGKSQTAYMHREILDVPKGTEIDHIDSDGLNNSRLNIRLCGRVENCQNTRGWIKKKYSEYKGVCWSKDHLRWFAHITIGGKFKHLGYYLTEFDAALKYDEASKRIFEDFARPNFGGI